MKNLSKLVLSGVVGFSALSGVMLMDSKEASAKTDSVTSATFHKNGQFTESKTEKFKVTSFDLSKQVGKAKAKKVEKEFNDALSLNIGKLSEQYNSQYKAYQETAYNGKKKVTVKQITTKGTHASYEVTGTFGKTVAKNYITINKKTGDVFNVLDSYKLLKNDKTEIMDFKYQNENKIFETFKKKYAPSKKITLNDYIKSSVNYGLQDVHQNTAMYVDNSGKVVINMPYLSGGIKETNIKYNGIYNTGIKAIN